MAGHDVTVDLNRVMSEAPSQDQYLIFDIQAASTEDIDGRLRAVAHYKFKQFGGGRFVLVVKREQWTMDQIKKVSQTGMCHVHPAEKVGKYYPYFGVTGFKDDVETLPTLTGSTEEVLMVEFTVRDKSASADEFKRMMTRLAEQYKGVINTHRQVTFHLTAHFPVKFYIFIDIEAHKLDRAYIEGSDVFGGPGNTEVVTTPVFRLP